MECHGEGGTRNTPDVDLLVRRDDFEAIKSALDQAGFVHQRLEGADMFLDGPSGKPRDAVHLVFAGEKRRNDDMLPAPEVHESVAGGAVRVLALEPLVRVKLTSYRLKDRVHLRDMLEVGLIDATWVSRFPPALAARLQHLIDTPEG